jgi:hypothetical protein
MRLILPFLITTLIFAVRREEEIQIIEITPELHENHN